MFQLIVLKLQLILLLFNLFLCLLQPALQLFNRRFFLFIVSGNLLERMIDLLNLLFELHSFLIYCFYRLLLFSYNVVHLNDSLLLLFYDLRVSRSLFFVFDYRRLELFAVFFLKLKLFLQHPKLVCQVRDYFIVSYDLLIVVADLRLNFSETLVSLFAFCPRSYWLCLSNSR